MRNTKNKSVICVSVGNNGENNQLFKKYVPSTAVVLQASQHQVGIITTLLARNTLYR
jgi:hypothetical protein